MTIRELLIFKNPLKLRYQTIFNRCYASFTKSPSDHLVDLTSAEEEPLYDIKETEEDYLEIEKKRNKSGLNNQDRNILHGRIPYTENVARFHGTIKYKRKMFGRYGAKASGVPPGIAWPIPVELEDMNEYERVAYPQTIQEVWKQIEEKNKRIKAEDIERQEQIVQNVAMLEKWKTELANKIAKKEKLAREAQQRKEAMIEEVRRHFGFKISPHDERFKELLLQKEKEDKKLKKEARKKKHEDYLASMAKMYNKEDLLLTDTKQNENTNTTAAVPVKKKTENTEKEPAK